MCVKDYNKEYRKNNRKKMAQLQNKYYYKNREKINEKRKDINKKIIKTKEEKEKQSLYNKNLYRLNRDKILKKQKIYQKNNPEKSREKIRRRRARVRGSAVEFYSETDVLKKYGSNCYICSLPIDLDAPRRVGSIGWERSLHIEHVIDIALGGPDTLANVRPSHGICNLTKKPNQNGIME